MAFSFISYNETNRLYATRLATADDAREHFGVFLLNARNGLIACPCTTIRAATPSRAGKTSGSRASWSTPVRCSTYRSTITSSSATAATPTCRSPAAGSSEAGPMRRPDQTPNRRGPRARPSWAHPRGARARVDDGPDTGQPARGAPMLRRSAGLDGHRVRGPRDQRGEGSPARPGRAPDRGSHPQGRRGRLHQARPAGAVHAAPGDAGG